MPACAHWPFASASPETDDAPLPNVPTLILSGGDDLRTPTADARALAARIPDAHSWSSPSRSLRARQRPGPCARDAVEAFFADHPIRPCPDQPLPSSARPVPLAPRGSLSWRAPWRNRPSGTDAQGGGPHRAGLQPRNSLLLSTSLEQGPGPAGGLRTGGLRAGWAIDLGRSIVFHRYSYIPGVRISGTLGIREATLRVSGRAAAHGTVHLGPDEDFRGVLGGKAVSLPRIAMPHSTRPAEPTPVFSAVSQGLSSALMVRGYSRVDGGPRLVNDAPLGRDPGSCRDWRHPVLAGDGPRGRHRTLQGRAGVQLHDVQRPGRP